MKTKLIYILASVLFFSSCQKVIQVDLNNANPNYVIEANLYDGVHDFKVKVSQTTSYFGTDNPPAVNDAQVMLIPNNGSSINVPFVSNGEYVLPAFNAATQTNYQLVVTVGGKTYSATSYMPYTTTMDSLSYEEFAGFGGGGPKDQFLMKAHFQDSVGVKNYYRVLITKNDTLYNKAFDYYIFDDKIRDGQYIDAPLFTTFFKPGDTVNVELLSMDAGVYDYFNTLSEILTSDANTSAAPANPNSNFNNGALGYFAAYASSKNSIRVNP